MSTVGKEFFLKKTFADSLPRQLSAKADVRVTARGAFSEGWRGRWQRLGQRSATWPSPKVSLPSNSLPTALCRAVGKGGGSGRDTQRSDKMTDDVY
jgi:hypothetical protein